MDLFGQDQLNYLFEQNDNNHLKRRETYTLEFKEEFNWSDKRSRIKYLKSIAAFANNKGGYLLFGVRNQPHEIRGIQNFDDVDGEEISTAISNYFSSEIHFERHLHEINGKNVGLIYIHESQNKPIICIKDYDDILFKSYIYYRYRAKSSHISPGDLVTLVNSIKEKESEKWQNIFRNVAQIGIDKVGILNPESGILESKGSQFLLDERLLDQLNIIDEYKSVEKDGAPAYRIVGDIQSSAKVISRSKILRDEDLIKGFLENRKVGQPIEYVKAVSYLSSGYFPIYHYLTMAKLSLPKAMEILKDQNKSSQSKKLLLQRVNNESKLNEKKDWYKLNANSKAGEIRKKYHDKIVNNEELKIESKDGAKRFLEAVLNLESGTYEENSLKNMMIEIFNNYYSTDLSGMIRYAVSYLDLIELRSNVEIL